MDALSVGSLPVSVALCKTCAYLGAAGKAGQTMASTHKQAIRNPVSLWMHDGATGGVIADAERRPSITAACGLADSGAPVLAPPAVAQSSLSLIRDFPQEHRGFS